MDLFTGVDWKETAILNSMRAVCAGIVWGSFAIYMGQMDVVAGYFFGMIFIYWLFIFPVGYFSGKLGQWGVPFAGIFSMMLSFMVAVGDPILFILSKIFRKLPVSPDFSPFNLAPIFLIMRDDVKHVHVL